MPTTADFLAAYVPWLAEPGDGDSLPITVPTGYEDGVWSAFVWRDERKGTALLTFTVVTVGQVVTVSYTATQAAALIPSGASSFSGWWEFIETPAGGQPRTWFKGPFVLDPKRRSTGSGAQAVTASILANAITVEATATGGGGGGGGYSTPSQVLAALVTVDGTGSTLDADTVDGSHASAFATTAALAAHEADTTAIHGITDTSVLATASSVATAITTHTGATDPHGDQAFATSAIATAIANLIASAPGALDTLDELAAALGDDANFAATVTTALAGKQPIDSDLTAIAALSATNDDVVQRKAGAWTNRTVAQLLTDILAAGLQASLDAKQPLDGDLTTIAGLTATTDNIIQSVGSAWASRTPTQAKAALSLGNVDNTSDANKPVSTATQTALDLKADLSITANGQSGTTYTLVLTDAGKVIECNNASAITLTVPTNASVAFPTGTVIEVYQQGAGQITVTAAGGVTLRAPGGAKTRVQYSTLALRKRAADEWVLAGDATS